jgi:hypothetical protein
MLSKAKDVLSRSFESENSLRVPRNKPVIVDLESECQSIFSNRRKSKRDKVARQLLFSDSEEDEKEEITKPPTDPLW